MVDRDLHRGSVSARHPDRVTTPLRSAVAGDLRHHRRRDGNPVWMLHQHRLDDARMARVAAALATYAWRRMSVRAVAVRLVAENDGEVVALDDGRVWMVKRALLACRWRGLTVAGVARQAAAALGTWHASHRRLDLELAWLLDSGYRWRANAPGSSDLGDSPAGERRDDYGNESRDRSVPCRSTSTQQARPFRA
jgi:hypothetical protein